MTKGGKVSFPAAAAAAAGRPAPRVFSAPLCGLSRGAPRVTEASLARLPPRPLAEPPQAPLGSWRPLHPSIEGSGAEPVALPLPEGVPGAPFGTSWLWDPIQALTGSGPAWLSMRSAGAATLLLMGISPGGGVSGASRRPAWTPGQASSGEAELSPHHFTRRGDLAPDPEVI